MTAQRKLSLPRLLWLAAGVNLLLVVLGGYVASPQPASAQFATNTLTPSPTIPPTIAPTLIATNVPGPFNGDGTQATWTPPAPTNRLGGNFLFGRPFAPPLDTYWARNYSYGADKNGTAIVHHGIDFPAPSGAPIVAIGDGVVYFAGPDDRESFAFRRNFYGNLVVIEHPFMYNNGAKIYTLYAHMSQVLVQKGDPIKTGQKIGLVGSTGVAFGPHLHVEVRVGDPHAYDSGRNPELWIRPYEHAGVIAGRVMDPAGNLLPQYRVELQSPGYQSFAFSYTGEGINGDDVLKENFAIPDVPEGYQTIFIRTPDNVLRYRQVVFVWAGQVTFVNINIVPMQP